MAWLMECVALAVSPTTADIAILQITFRRANQLCNSRRFHLTSKLDALDDLRGLLVRKGIETCSKSIEVHPRTPS